MSALLKQPPQANSVVGKAVIKAAEDFNINNSQLGKVIGFHRTAISRLKANPDIDPNTKQGELSLMFIRVYRALYALAGGDLEWMRHFLVTHNKVTGGVPIKQMETIGGLVAVLQFLDGIRGKV